MVEYHIYLNKYFSYETIPDTPFPFAETVPAD